MEQKVISTYILHSLDKNDQLMSALLKEVSRIGKSASKGLIFAGLGIILLGYQNNQQQKEIRKLKKEIRSINEELDAWVKKDEDQDFLD